MRVRLVLAALVVASCHGKEPSTGTGSATTTTPTAPAAPTAMGAPTPGSGGAAMAGSGSAAVAAQSAPVTPPAPASPPLPAGGHDFTTEAKALLVVGACGEGALPDGVTQDAVATHCDDVKKAQADYVDNWVKPASAFFAAHVPKDIPKKVVYPFAGGDLSTALTVYPDADEITNISLEPAGDPRTVDSLRGGDLDRALKKVAYELKFLYRVNFSNTINMIDAMRGGALPTELIFALSALKIHGYEVVGLRYFKLDDDGAVHYLDDDDLAKAPKAAKAETRNWFFANAELQFRKAGGRVQVYRHIRQNLGNDESKGIGPGLKKDPRVLKYLEAKGPIAAMTKAASYLLSWESFSLMRDYLLSHVVWMVSDATGIAPKWGRPAGFEYETYGTFVGPHIPAGSGISKDWRTEFETEPHRDLDFRFGYYDIHNANHLIIMRKKSS
ncbi:MAG TPA: hypothetical protein VH143_01770 [Kofleriaceae bacterium]|nr:hypothetical protein [Kofleriaceae bacterium]